MTVSINLTMIIMTAIICTAVCVLAWIGNKKK